MLITPLRYCKIKNIISFYTYDKLQIYIPIKFKEDNSYKLNDVDIVYFFCVETLEITNLVLMTHVKCLTVVCRI